MLSQFSRTELLLGSRAMERLSRARVALFGVGGVGGHAAEALIRCGMGTLDILDDDQITLTNLNRQLIATHSTLGMYKVDAMKARLLDINPDATIHARRMFYLPENGDTFDFSVYDYVIDAIDTVKAKLDIVQRCDRLGVPVISAMGAGNKLHPALFEVADIYDTKVCPLARVMRVELKKRGVKKLKVVYSQEPPITPGWDADAPTEDRAPGSSRRSLPGSVAFSPSVMGLIIASEVVKDLCGEQGESR